MADLRTVLAAVLGIGLGLVLVAFPVAVIRVQTVGRLPDDRGDEYGRPASPPDSWRRVIQGIGVGLVVAGLYFGASVVGLLGRF